MISSKYNYLVGKTFNNIKILELSRKDSRSRVFVKIKCLNCGEISEMRGDRFSGTQKLECCSKCRQSNAIKKSKERASAETVYRSLYCTYKSGAKTRGIDFKLKYEVFKVLIKEDCAYCMSKPVESLTSKRMNRTNIPVFHNGIDRMDNNKGYTLENSIPCCSKCNMMKKVMTFNEFTEHVEKIYNWLFFHKK